MLYYLCASVETAIARPDRRKRDGVADAHALDADAITHLSGIFEAPTADEGLEVHTVED